MGKRFGETIRERREARGITLRAAAALLEVSPAYLSRLEREQESPTQARVGQIAALLELPPDPLFALAQQVAPELSQYVASTPSLPAFLRTAQAKGLGPKDFERLTAEIEKLPTKKKGGRP